MLPPQLKPELSPITWKIAIAFMAVLAMYGTALCGVPFPDGLSTLVGLAVGFMFRDPDTKGWRGMMGALMFVMTLAIWIFNQVFYQEALLGMAFGNLFKNSNGGGEEPEEAPKEPHAEGQPPKDPA